MAARPSDEQTDNTATDSIRDGFVARIGLRAFDHPRVAALAWLLLAVFGIICYTTLLKREGFPSVNIPITVITGTYLVNDPQQVDRELAKPMSDAILKDSRVSSVLTQTRGPLVSVTVQYKDEDVDVAAANKAFESDLKKANLPKQAAYQIMSPKFGFTQRGDDAVVSVYSDNRQASAQDLKQEGQRFASYLEGYFKGRNYTGMKSASVIDPFTEATDPQTGQPRATQTKFDGYGVRQDDANVFYPSVSVGIAQEPGSDVIELDDHLRQAVDAYNGEHRNDGFGATVSASYATDIKAQISELQRSLFEGLLAVLVIGSVIIAIRASLITVLSMLTVLAVTVSVLYLVGYTLNTITLFSLVLCLGLIVDDTIIMVEALDAQRRRLARARDVVRTATRKVSRAMVAATFTAALSFAPLLFVGGVLGGFIRAIPVTVIISLLVSLLVALVGIPLFARYLLLGNKQLQAGQPGGPERLRNRVEGAATSWIVRPMLWARSSRRRLLQVGLSAVVVGILFVGAGMFLFQKVTFNIFPPSKDANALTVALQFNPGTSIEQAEEIATRADKVVAEKLGDTFSTASYYSSGSDQRAQLVVRLTPYDKRDERSPQLRDQLQSAFVGFAGATVTVNQQDVGPPPSGLTAKIVTDNRQAAMAVVRDMRTYFYSRQLERPSGTTASINNATITDDGTYARDNGRSYVSIALGFDATDTSTLVGVAQRAIEDRYDAAKLASFGLPAGALQFDLGQEQENQDSFRLLLIAFPALLLAIYFLLAFQFRSLAQPLLIFLAIPFSLFGITLGLYLTDNAFSFFAMLGFFALIGLSLKNTILLTDYANQLRRQGESAVDAAVGALRERFRPLLATSLTAIVSLIPLALTSPFWEGLAVVLIFGLLSSTLLVVTVFPYYYLGAEFLRWRVRRGPLVVMIALTGVLCAVALVAKLPWYSLLIAVALSLLLVVTNARERNA